MAKDNSELPRLPKHGALVLPRVEVKSYNVEIEDTTGYVGDKASKSAFRGHGGPGAGRSSPSQSPRRDRPLSKTLVVLR